MTTMTIKSIRKAFITHPPLYYLRPLRQWRDAVPSPAITGGRVSSIHEVEAKCTGQATDHKPWAKRESARLRSGAIEWLRAGSSAAPSAIWKGRRGAD